MTADFESASRYIYARLNRELPPLLTYHSLFHTRDDVVPAAERLGRAMGIGQADWLVLMTAALYHDTGFLRTYENHEHFSIFIARETLPDFGYSAAHIEAVADLIAATKMPQRPNGLLQEIICDADLDLLGRNDFMHLNRLLLDEVRHYTDRPIADRSWLLDQTRFLENHQFFTATARDYHAAGKASNLAMMRAALASSNGSVPHAPY